MGLSEKARCYARRAVLAGEQEREHAEDASSLESSWLAVWHEPTDQSSMQTSLAK